MRLVLAVLALAVLATGCSSDQVATPTFEATSQAQATGISNYSIIKNGIPMGVIQWRVKIKNNSNVEAVRLVVDCLDRKNNIVAEDDRDVSVKPGCTLDLSSEFDVPAAAVEQMYKVAAYLVYADEGARR